MGTSNFYNRNASNVFAFGEDFDQFDHDWFVDDLKEQLKKLGYATGGKPWSSGLRSYSQTALGSKTVSKLFGGIEVIVSVQALVRSGYYAGANLDWDICVEFAGLPLKTEWPYDYKYGSSEIEGILWSDCGFNKGMAIIQAPNVRYFIESAQESLILELEGFYREVTTPLNVTARFSNGETFYSEAN